MGSRLSHALVSPPVCDCQIHFALQGFPSCIGDLGSGCLFLLLLAASHETLLFTYLR